MLILVPALTYLVTFLVLTEYNRNRTEDKAGWWRCFLLTIPPTLGEYMVIYSEILSLFNALLRPCMATCWGIALAAALWFGW